MMKEFPPTLLKRSTLNDLIRRIDETGSEMSSNYKKSRKPVWNRLVKNSFTNDCRSLLQPVEDILNTTLTNVHGATCTLSNLRVLL